MSGLIANLVSRSIRSASLLRPEVPSIFAAPDHGKSSEGQWDTSMAYTSARQDGRSMPPLPANHDRFEDREQTTDPSEVRKFPYTRSTRATDDPPPSEASASGTTIDPDRAPGQRISMQNLSTQQVTSRSGTTQAITNHAATPDVDAALPIAAIPASRLEAHDARMGAGHGRRADNDASHDGTVDLVSDEQGEIHSERKRIVQDTHAAIRTSHVDRVPQAVSAQSLPESADEIAIATNMKITPAPNLNTRAFRGEDSQIPDSHRANSKSVLEDFAGDAKHSGTHSSASPERVIPREGLAANAPALNGLDLLRALRAISTVTEPRESNTEKVIQVSIGRIEVRAPSSKPAKAPAHNAVQGPSLEEYLRERTGRGRA